ncbi:hypothetical protein J7E62_22160 [Variovorax paradoxus]|nr:hypothetical protein [Variovorax paradoxus]
MDRIDTAEALIEAAAAAVETARAYILEGCEPDPFLKPTDLGSLSPVAQEEATRLERETHRARPEWTAIHSCLTSSSHLLEISHDLLQPLTSQSPVERSRRRKQLVDEAKTAGRGAYRAALILSDATL